MQEYYPNFIDLEIIDAEDCTENLEDIVGNINMMETRYGDLTGVNAHLQKEKSEVFNEAKQFHHNIQHTRGTGSQFGSREFEEEMANHSMILQGEQNSMFLRPNRSMANFNKSQVHNNIRNSSTFYSNVQNNQDLLRNNTLGPTSIHNRYTDHQRNPSDRPGPTPMLYSTNNFNDSLHLRTSHKLNSVMNNSAFDPNNTMQINLRRPSTRRVTNNYGRKQSMKNEVIQQYARFHTKANFNDSMISQKRSMIYKSESKKSLGERNSMYSNNKSMNSNMDQHRVNVKNY